MSRVAKWRSETHGTLAGYGDPAPILGYNDARPRPANLDEFWAIHGRCEEGVRYGRDDSLGEVAMAECLGCPGSTIWFMEGFGPTEVYHEVKDED